MGYRRGQRYGSPEPIGGLLMIAAIVGYRKFINYLYGSPEEKLSGLSLTASWETQMEWVKCPTCKNIMSVPVKDRQPCPYCSLENQPEERTWLIDQ